MADIAAKRTLAHGSFKHATKASKATVSPFDCGVCQGFDGLYPHVVIPILERCQYCVSHLSAPKPTSARLRRHPAAGGGAGGGAGGDSAGGGAAGGGPGRHR